MRHPKTIIAGIGLAAVAAVGGITAASVGGSAATRPPSATTHSAGQSPAPIVRTAPASVAGKTETILVNAHGLPLYFYKPDTATNSLVSGSLAALWPPVTSATPTATGVNTKLTVVNDAHGHQIAYHGHLLYTFVSDHADQVTGQGVQNFFVATPGVAQVSASSAGAGPAPAAPSGGGLGY
ncbi:MAG TPA: hypothetical protein VG253_06200 [Streptosporangiaceae bacterium]|jgi:predicted lipoprotein with Yx(FWY)xxD motif|nr:hypothetical protein [Streptosporangiaceae bacterium]